MNAEQPVNKLKNLITFDMMWEMGWRTLVPIIPPGAQMSPQSKIPEDQRGKAPGILYPVGWGGMHAWQQIKPNREEYRKWDRMGASIGVRCDEIVGIDCDIDDKELSLAVLKAVRTLPIPGMSETHPFRVGKSPKWCMPVWLPGGTPGWNLTFTHPRLPQQKFQVQFLGHGRQFVVWGVHPKTNELYKWSCNQRPPLVNDLCAIDTAQLEQIKACVVQTLESLGATLVQSGGNTAQAVQVINQDQLKGDRELITAALAAIPNDMDYDGWQSVAAALRGAAQDWDDAGLDLFLEFSDRCLRVEANLDDAKRKYLSYHPPFRLGAQFIYDKAASYGFNKAKADFTPQPGSAERIAKRELDKDAVRWGEEVRTVLAQATTESSRYADVALAHRFIDEHTGKLVYVGERGLWHAWDGQRWKPDATRSVHNNLVAEFLTREAFRARATAAETKVEEKERHKLVTRLLSNTQNQNVSRLVRDPLTISQAVLDQDTWALNTPGGLIDLRTGEYMEANDRKRYVTRITGCAPAPAGTLAPRWLRFLDEVTQADDELVAWLQRAFGYTLYGELTEQTMYFLYGEGGNGKGVLLNTIKAILGAYTTTADRSVFLKTRNAEHATVRASLAGSRLISVPEVPQGAEWNEAVLKEFSAGDAIKARFIGQNEFEYTPQGTLWFSGNDKPALGKIDPAIERRFRLITFDFRPERPDPNLKAYLYEQEGPAILRWLIDGCLQWQRNGLGSCAAVDKETQAYFAEHDPIRHWAQECCVFATGERSGSRELWESYKTWYKQHIAEAGDGAEKFAQSETAFGAQVKNLPGVSKHKSMGRMVLLGIAPRLRVVGREILG